MPFDFGNEHKNEMNLLKDIMNATTPKQNTDCKVVNISDYR